MRKFKLIIFILLIIVFIIVLFFGIFGTSLSYLSSKEIKENRELKRDLIKELKINNVDTVYDKNNNIYYYMISENYEDNIYVLNIELEDEFKYKIVGETLNIIRVDYDKPIKIIIYNDKYYYETKIQLTNLPLINIITEEKISFSDTQTIFNYINSNNTEKIITTNSMMHIRGATSKYFNKSSYKIDFYNKSYTDEKKLYISKFYHGDSLILDAVYRDPSKIRNVLSTELWNDISNNFKNVNMYSEFVEVFINNEYKGLYVLTEPVNRRKLSLNKSTSIETSVVVKSSGWSVVTSNSNIELLEDDIYMEYELKYPNDSSLYSVSWKKILGKISKYYDLFTDSSYATISETFNLDNYIDLVIFNAFINNSDNDIKKNNYFYMKNSEDNEVYIQPWDMEYSFGLNFAAEDKKFISKNINDYNEIYTSFIHENASEINELLIDRYWELRKNILTKEYFDNLLDNYKNELNKGAAVRDSNVWYEYDIEKEIEDIRTWIYNRLDYFDMYVESLENEQS